MKLDKCIEWDNEPRDMLFHPFQLRLPDRFQPPAKKACPCRCHEWEQDNCCVCKPTAPAEQPPAKKKDDIVMDCSCGFRFTHKCEEQKEKPAEQGKCGCGLDIGHKGYFQGCPCKPPLPKSELDDAIELAVLNLTKNKYNYGVGVKEILMNLCALVRDGMRGRS